MLFRSTGKLVTLSEQNLVDCDPKNYGCKGGLEIYAFDFVMRKGISLEKDYPYEGKKGTCRFSKSKKSIPISSYKSLRDKDEIEQNIFQPLDQFQLGSTQALAHFSTIIPEYTMMNHARKIV